MYVRFIFFLWFLCKMRVLVGGMMNIILILSVVDVAPFIYFIS